MNEGYESHSPPEKREARDEGDKLVDGGRDTKHGGLPEVP